MGTIHVVAQGEYVSKLARVHGFASHHTIWDAPENKGLKEKRKNPNILYPGDLLFIPDKETKEESRPTDKHYRFERESEKLLLRIALKDLKNHPVQKSQCTLHVETDSHDFVTGSDGIIEQEITHPEQVNQGLLLGEGKVELSLPEGARLTLKIGELHPVTKVSGQMARLNNLGYDAGEVPEKPFSETEALKASQTPQFISAVQEFQCDFMGQNDLAIIKQVVDGKCGPKTQAKLVKVHGC
jgi:N-acetylmuramoyl-L-alanine amidase